ncbi:hypothetical protein VNO80_07216 [Phaseolus coccineus]|uniref:Uncharacterized protein n=1 Tax=Phaseolus coccineus TaxID=3886 RepID=A0AAN9NJC1_PHACN
MRRESRGEDSTITELVSVTVTVNGPLPTLLFPILSNPPLNHFQVQNQGFVLCGLLLSAKKTKCHPSLLFPLFSAFWVF